MTMMNQRQPRYDTTDRSHILQPRVYSDVLSNPHSMKQAMEFRDMGLMGLWIVIASVGGGKDVFAHYMALKQRHLFVDRQVAIDAPPRKLFDSYPGNRGKTYKEINYDEIREIIYIQKNILKKRRRVNQELDDLEIEDDDQRKEIEENVDDWLRSDEWSNRIFPDTTAIFTEYWRWFKKRDAFNPLGQYLAGVHRIFRHENALVIGLAQKWNELDTFAVQEHITAKVSCSWNGVNVKAMMLTKKRMTASGVLNFGGTAKIIRIHPLRPQEILGGGKWFDIYNSFNKQSLTTR